MKKTFYGVIAVAIVGIILAAFALPSWSKTPAEEFTDLQERVSPFLEEKYAEEKNSAVKAVKAKMVEAVSACGVEVKDAVITAAPSPSVYMALNVLTTTDKMITYEVIGSEVFVGLLFSQSDAVELADYVQQLKVKLEGDKLIIS